MYNLAIRKCTSPPLLAPRLKILNQNLLPRRGLNPGPAEPEADMLPSEPTRRAVKSIKIFFKKRKIIYIQNISRNFIGRIAYFSLHICYYFNISTP